MIDPVLNTLNKMTKITNLEKYQYKSFLFWVGQFIKHKTFGSMVIVSIYKSSNNRNICPPYIIAKDLNNEEHKFTASSLYSKIYKGDIE